ncbi:MAG: hypothetical protein M9949_10745 [Candidatus Kapabacteria bacterium]|nr:hypothetical protein [Candidatus Kapabacteria bacterium]
MIAGKAANKEVLFLTELEKQAKKDLGILEGQRAKTTATNLFRMQKNYSTQKRKASLTRLSKAYNC